MVSDSLMRLRNLDQEHASLVKEIRKRTRNITENSYLDDAKRRQFLSEHISISRQQLADLKYRREEETIDAREAPFFSDEERRWRTELREASINNGLLASNEKAIVMRSSASRRSQTAISVL